MQTKNFLAVVLSAIMVFSVTNTLSMQAQAVNEQWTGRDLTVRVNGIPTNIGFSANTSQLSLNLEQLLVALNLPANYVQFIPNSEGQFVLSAGNPAIVVEETSFSAPVTQIRQHLLAELLNIDIIFDMYTRTVDITTNSTNGGTSRVLPVQYIPRYGWVRMTDEMLRDIERIMGEDVARQMAEEGLYPVQFCPYISAGNRHFAFDMANRPYLSLFTHTERAATGSNALARAFYGSLYRPGVHADVGIMPSSSTSLSLNLYDRTENGLATPDWMWLFSNSLENGNAREDAARRRANADLAVEPYYYVGIGRHFDERTGNFYSGNIQFGRYNFQQRNLAFGRDTVETTDWLYLFFVDGYRVTYIDWYGEREEVSRTPISGARARTNCPFLNGFETMELTMLEEPFVGEPRGNNFRRQMESIGFRQNSRGVWERNNAGVRESFSSQRR
ncbi:MAG: hypothetical protein FWG68_00450 [Defluviitaleaceae bacterium]|nr:hypothetical protein [Defluviitaleaceae bacterium]